MIDKAEIKKYIDKKYAPPNKLCPFRVIQKTEDKCIRYCGPIFHKWASLVKQYSSDIFDCPCAYLSCAYVVRKFRKWLNE